MVDGRGLAASAVAAALATSTIVRRSARSMTASIPHVRILSVVHQIDAGSGVFGAAAERRTHEVAEWIPVQGPPPDGAFDAVMVFGGDMHPDQEEKHPWLRREKDLIRSWLEAGVPLLTTCLGSELLAEAAGGATERMPEPQIGWYEVALTPEADDDPVLAGLPGAFTAFQWHSYATPLPDGAVCLAQGGAYPQAFRIGDAWGFQFHAEVTTEIVGGWLDRYSEDEDAVRIGFDPEPVRAETTDRMAGWNAIGDRIAEGFLGHVDARRL